MDILEIDSDFSVFLVIKMQICLSLKEQFKMKTEHYEVKKIFWMLL